MADCSNCDSRFEGTGLCPECLAELGIQKSTAEHLHLLDGTLEPGPSADGAEPENGESRQA